MDGSNSEHVEAVLRQSSGLVEANDIQLSPNIDPFEQQISPITAENRGHAPPLRAYAKYTLLSQSRESKISPNRQRCGQSRRNYYCYEI